MREYYSTIGMFLVPDKRYKYPAWDIICGDIKGTIEQERPERAVKGRAYRVGATIKSDGRERNSHVGYADSIFKAKL